MMRVTAWCLVALSLLLVSSVSYAVPTKLRLYLDWFPNVEFAGIYAAIEDGSYAKENIDLTLIYNGLNIIDQVMTGRADIGMHSAHDLLRGRTKYRQIRAFGTQYQINPNSIIVGQTSRFKSVKDLKGATLGITSPQDYDMFRIMLGNSGLSLKDVTFKDLNTFDPKEIIDVMKSGKVDAIIAWEFDWTITFALLGYNVRIFPGYQNGFHFYCSVFFGPDLYVTNHRELLAKFLRITFDGWRKVFKNPERYAKLVVSKYYPRDKFIQGSESLTLKQQSLEIRLRQRYFFEGVSNERMGDMSRYKWRRSIDIARQYGIIAERTKLLPDDIVDFSILESLFGGHK